LASCAPEPRRVEIGRRLPPFELPSLQGGTVASDDLAGDRPVLINFWATWCSPCLREIPALQELHATGGVDVVSINLDTLDALDDGEVREFVQSHGIEYEVLRGEISTLTSYGSTSIPYTLVLDGDLTVRFIHQVTVSRSTLERDLSAAR
jgi:thiol-disulfide isomerase/thioredoxin